MKVKVSTTKRIEKEIEIEFPFYAKHDLSGDRHDSVHYMKIEERKVTTIEDVSGDEGESFKLEVEEGAILSSHLSYIEDTQYHSSKAQYERACERMGRFVQKNLG